MNSIFQTNDSFAPTLATSKLDEKGFLFRLNENAIATEKLAEGIRKFAADTANLEKEIASKLGQSQKTFAQSFPGLSAPQ